MKGKGGDYRKVTEKKGEKSSNQIISPYGVLENRPLNKNF
jgi:hypothetical protein